MQIIYVTLGTFIYHLYYFTKTNVNGLVIKLN